MIKKYKFGEVSNEEIFARFEPTSSVEDIVSDIIKNVRANGDKALYEYCEKFDKAKLTSLEVTEAEIEEMSGNRQRIIVSSLPYQVNKANLIKAISDLSKDKKVFQEVIKNG